MKKYIETISICAVVLIIFLSFFIFLSAWIFDNNRTWLKGKEIEAKNGISTKTTITVK